jgi:hypothetical protein
MGDKMRFTIHIDVLKRVNSENGKADYYSQSSKIRCDKLSHQRADKRP